MTGDESGLTLPVRSVGADTGAMTDRISKAEIRKDALQDGLDAAATTVGQVATIITGAVRDVVRSVGDLATELFEIRDAARRAGEDAVGDADGEADDDVPAREAAAEE